MSNERTRLLWQSSYQDQPTTTANPNDAAPPDPHAQFCMMVGIPSSAPVPDGKRHSSVPPKSLYGRATRQLFSQRWTYYSTATLSNTMLLTQVMLGAALTALGASESSHILITVFGALNTVIAGLVAYLKSRGQPMRARMYRDDLERVVDEIENSEVMWLGISKGVHGYEDIDTGSNTDGKDGSYERNPNAVTVRSEVARLMRLYDRAVRNNTVNNPDMYMTGGADGSGGATLRNRVGGGGAAVSAPVPVMAPVSVAPSAAVPPVAAPAEQPHDPDESPATAPAPPKPKEEKKQDQEEAKPEVKKEEEETKGKAKADGDDGEGETLSKTTTAADRPQGEEAAPAPPPAPAPPVGPSQPATQEPPRDPDAEPASDPTVPLKKVAGDPTDAES